MRGLKKDDVVDYHNGHSEPERGVVTAVGVLYVFVRFGEEGTTANACDPLDLIKVRRP